MGDVGVVQRSLGGNKQFSMGTVPQRVRSFLTTLDVFLQSPGAVFSSIVLANQTNKGQTSGVGDIVMETMKIMGKTTSRHENVYLI